ncbi:MAG: DNA translocase FtsK 4TM domain-containing protein, partial [Methylocystis sp.]
MTRSQSLGPAYDPFREFARRRLAELLGLATLAACAALTLALFTWSARDPSFNQATDARVHNLLGLPGAVVADLFMQTIGVATSAALLPIAALGLRLLSHRGVERARLRAVLWFIGVVCAAAAASLLPVTDRWPLPTGLGGVVGDAVLSLPRHVTGGNRLVLALIGVVAIVGAILSLTAAAGYGLESEADMREEARRQALGQRALQHDEDDEDAAGEPGVALVSLGALLHFLLMVQSSFRRGFARLGASLRRPAAADFEPRPIGPAERREPIFDDLDDYDSPPPPRRPAASIENAPS